MRNVTGQVVRGEDLRLSCNSDGRSLKVEDPAQLLVVDQDVQAGV